MIASMKVILLISEVLITSWYWYSYHPSEIRAWRAKYEPITRYTNGDADYKNCLHSLGL